VTYDNEKLHSHFLVGFHSRYSDVVSYPLLLEYWDLLEHVKEIPKEPHNSFRREKNYETILKI